MLVVWLADNDARDETSIKIVQFKKNSAHHSGIKFSQYSALFGGEDLVGLATSSLPQEVLKKMEGEDNLLAEITDQHFASAGSRPSAPTPSVSQASVFQQPPFPEFQRCLLYTSPSPRDRL